MKKIYVSRLRCIEFYFFILIGLFWIFVFGPIEYNGLFEYQEVGI